MRLSVRSASHRRLNLAERLAERRPEIERAVLDRVQALSDPVDVADPEYAIGLREAVGVALAYGIEGIASGGEPPPVPQPLLVQARAAARNGVGLDTVFRRYLAGHALLCDLLVEEASEAGVIATEELREAIRAEVALLDRLLLAIYAEHAREGEGGGESERRTRRVRRLLAGEPVDPTELRYELDAWHVAAIASGPGALAGLREFAAALDRRLLSVPVADVFWAWLGGRARLEASEALERAADCFPADARLALGESGEGFEGWRRSHRQAKAAMSVARRSPERRLRYADIALLSAVLRDEVLAASLRESYLAPLCAKRDGEILLETLRAYFACGRNASAAAAALGISRQTANSRLRAVEERIGRSLEGCAAEMETALRLVDLDGSTAGREQF